MEIQKSLTLTLVANQGRTTGHSIKNWPNLFYGALFRGTVRLKSTSM